MPTVAHTDRQLGQFLATLARGEDCAFALDDFLLENGDERAALVRKLGAQRYAYRVCDEVIWGPSLLRWFDVQPCSSCHALDCGDVSAECPECRGIGWSYCLTRIRIPAKLERWYTPPTPARVPLIGKASQP